MISESTAAYEALVEISGDNGDAPTGTVTSCEPLGKGFQPLLSPDDCDLTESIVKLDDGVAKLLEERYGITDIGEIERETDHPALRKTCESTLHLSVVENRK